MMESKRELIYSYVKANVAPILVDFLSAEDLKEEVVLPANVGTNELTGHYEGTEYVPPKWYEEILKSNGRKALVIDQIDTISKEEQMKFGEILAYRKISTFDLPKDCVVIVTAKKINKERISEEIFSLCARI